MPFDRKLVTFSGVSDASLILGILQKPGTCCFDLLHTPNIVEEPSKLLRRLLGEAAPVNRPKVYWVYVLLVGLQGALKRLHLGLAPPLQGEQSCLGQTQRLHFCAGERASFAVVELPPPRWPKGNWGKLFICPKMARLQRRCIKPFSLQLERGVLADGLGRQKGISAWYMAPTCSSGGLSSADGPPTPEVVAALGLMTGGGLLPN